MKVQVDIQECAAHLFPNGVEFDTEAGSQESYEDIVYCGYNTRLSAAITHLRQFHRNRDGVRKDANGNPVPPREPTDDEYREVIEGFVAKYNNPAWKPGVREGRARMSLEERVLRDLLKPRFEKAGALRKARAAKPAANGKPAVEAREAVTVDTLIAAHGSPEAAFRAVNREFIFNAWREKGVTEFTDEHELSVQRRSDEGWAKFQAEVAKEVKARQRAAQRAENADPESVSL